jgi:hypothetical protein
MITALVMMICACASLINNITFYFHRMCNTISDQLAYLYVTSNYFCNVPSSYLSMRIYCNNKYNIYIYAESYLQITI